MHSNMAPLPVLTLLYGLPGAMFLLSKQLYLAIIFDGEIDILDVEPDALCVLQQDNYRWQSL